MATPPPTETDPAVPAAALDHGAPTRPRWREIGQVALAVLLGVAVAAIGYVRWDREPVHGATVLFTRTTSDGVTVEVARGDVRWEHLFCADGRTQCTERTPGLRVTFTLPDGRTGGATIPDATGPVTDERTACPVGSGPPTVEVRTVAGLSIPPGSADEQFVVVRTSPGVRSVRLLRPDGSADEMTPVDGTAVLATRTGFDPTARVQALDPTGAPLPTC